MSSPRQKKLEELHCKKVDADIKKLQEIANYIEELMRDLESVKECVWPMDQAELILKKINNEINNLFSLTQK